MLALLQLDGAWDRAFLYGPSFVIVLLMVVVVLRLAPLWAKVRTRELELRSSEVTVRGEEAKALTMLADVLRDVSVVHRQATEHIQQTSEMIDLVQRVNADRSDKLNAGLAALSEKFDQVGDLQRLAESQNSLAKKVEALESQSHVQPQTAAA